MSSLAEDQTSADTKKRRAAAEKCSQAIMSTIKCVTPDLSNESKGGMADDIGRRKKKIAKRRNPRQQAPAPSNRKGDVARKKRKRRSDKPRHDEVTVESPSMNDPEAFRKDRENFLSTYLKPIKIYGYLKARLVERPLFLQRNLSYMKGRISRSQKPKPGFKVDSLPEVIQEKRRQQRGMNSTFRVGDDAGFYNIILTGLTDGQTWIRDASARVDFYVVQESRNNRKNVPDSRTKVCGKTMDLKVYSPPAFSHSKEGGISITIPPPALCPTMSIPWEVCPVGTMGHVDILNYSVVVRVTIPQAWLLLNSPQLIPRSDAGEKGRNVKLNADDLVVYMGRVDIYENDGTPKSIGEADYEMILKRFDATHRNKMRVHKIRKESSWNTVQKYDIATEQNLVGKYAKFCFTLRTSLKRLPSYVRFPSPLLRPAVKVENSASTTDLLSLPLTRQEKLKSVRVIYRVHYISENMDGMGMQVESRDDLTCPWCAIKCPRLFALLKHLDLCHPRFRQNFAPISNGAIVDVFLDESFETISNDFTPKDLLPSGKGKILPRKGPREMSPKTLVLVWRPPRSRKQSIEEFFAFSRFTRAELLRRNKRVYFHSVTNLPIQPNEVNVDSEEEADPEWFLKKTTMEVDAFHDVNKGEKELMKMWNLFLIKHKKNIRGDCHIPTACESFVKIHGKEILEKNLYKNLCLHLANLFDFGLLKKENVHATIVLLQQQYALVNKRI